MSQLPQNLCNFENIDLPRWSKRTEVFDSLWVKIGSEPSCCNQLHILPHHSQYLACSQCNLCQNLCNFENIDLPLFKRTEVFGSLRVKIGSEPSCCTLPQLSQYLTCSQCNNHQLRQNLCNFENFDLPRWSKRMQVFGSLGVKIGSEPSCCHNS